MRSGSSARQRRNSSDKKRPVAPSPKLDQHYRLRRRYVIRKEGKEGILFDSETGEITILNDTATAILMLCGQGASRDKIIDRMKKVYASAVKGSVEKDIDVFLRQAAAAGLLDG